MPSEHQHGTNQSAEYESEEHREVSELPERKLMQIEPMVEETARAYLAACNRENVSDDLKEHFARCIRQAPY